MHDVELPEGLTREHVRERTLAAGGRLESGRWSRPFFVAAMFLAVELPACALSDWLDTTDSLSDFADGAPEEPLEARESTG